ncbi:MAG TPA: hypothetical protein VHV78_02925 [Gemmatimonadaceae bacterium]|nr:hypothetical protein [Gemmatimonadaceae bacterium]
MHRTETHRRRTPEALLQFLDYVAELDRAVIARDARIITSLLRKRTATHLPREVREELLAFSRAPRESLRAPIQFLRFGHRMTELARGGERMLAAQRELPFNELEERGESADANSTRAARRTDTDHRTAAARPKKKGA